MAGRPIALELSHLNADAPFDVRPTLVGVIEDLVSLLETQIPEDAEFPVEPLRTRLKHSRMRISAAQTPDDLTDAGLRLVGDASQTHARIAGHVSGREAELFGVIRLLRELVDGLRGDAQVFRADISASSDRVADLAKIEDVRTLRRALSREVDGLRRSVQAQVSREENRLTQLSGTMQQLEGRLAQHEQDADRATRLPRRQALERRLASVPVSEGCTLILLRIDEPDDIIRGHGQEVLDRVVLCLAQVLQVTFGEQTVVYRVDDDSVAMAATEKSTRVLAQLLRQAQARMAPAYDYEAQGTTRSVMFTFSSGLADRTSGEAPADFVHRAETLAAHAASQGRGRMEVAASKLGRLLGWM